MKKTNKVKMGPLGTPLGNPLAYFNSLKGKNKVEPKQTFKFGGLRKKECGGDTGVPCPEETTVTPTVKPLGFKANVGDFSAGYTGKVGPTAITDNKINAAYNNTTNGLGVKGAYDFNDKSVNAGVTYKNNGFGVQGGYDSKKGVNAGINYTGNIKNVPVKVGFTYNKKGGSVKMQKGGTHKMPNGKMMLNSAMKKRTSKKK